MESEFKDPEECYERRESHQIRKNPDQEVDHPLKSNMDLSPLQARGEWLKND